MNFLLLLGFLFVATTAFDVLSPVETQCSIGFSGVVLGLLVWSGFNSGYYSFSTATLLSLLWILIVPVLGDSRISFSGHLYGVLAGLLATAVIRV